VLLVRVASTAVVTRMLGGNRDQVINAVSNAWIDGWCAAHISPRSQHRISQELGCRRRHQPCRAPCLHRDDGRNGYPSALSAKTWGFYDVLFKGKPFSYSQGFGSYVMENVLFKISYPAEFHAQTAVECAMKLHPLVKDKLDQVDRVVIETQEPGVRIIDRRARWPILPIATIAFNTWPPFR